MSVPPGILRAPTAVGGSYRAEEGMLGAVLNIPPTVGLLSPPIVAVNANPSGQVLVSFTVGRVAGLRDRRCEVAWRVVSEPGGLVPIDFVGDAFPADITVLEAGSGASFFTFALNPSEPVDVDRFARVELFDPVRCVIDGARAGSLLRVNRGRPPVETGPWEVVWSDPGDAALWATVWGGAGAPP